MARGNFRVVTQMSPVFSTTWNVASGAAESIKAGEPTEASDAAAASPYTGNINIMADGEGTTSQRFTGVAKSDSTDTASAAGECTTWLPLPGIIYSGAAKTASTADTAAEVQALQGKRVVFDLTSTTWSIDAAAADAVANCVIIIGGEYQTQTLYWMYRPAGTVLDFVISA